MNDSPDSILVVAQYAQYVSAFIVFLGVYFLASYIGRHKYRKTGRFFESYIFAVSIFVIVLDVLVPLTSIVVLSPLDLYGMLIATIVVPLYWMGWIMKFGGVLFLYFAIRKHASLVAAVSNVNIATSQPAHHFPWSTFVVAIIAAIVILGPLLFRLSDQVSSTKIQTEVEQTVDENSAQIQDALEKYKSVYNTYPVVLQDLIPSYLEKIPFHPRGAEYEYDPNAQGTDYRLCTYVDTGKKCITSSGNWSALRAYCSGTKQPGENCQQGSEPESQPF